MLNSFLSKVIKKKCKNCGKFIHVGKLAQHMEENCFGGNEAPQPIKIFEIEPKETMLADLKKFYKSHNQKKAGGIKFE